MGGWVNRCSRFIARSTIALRRSRTLRWGVSATAAWLGFVCLYLSTIADWSALRQPNQFGDFFAGIFAPIAFFWLIVTVFMQSRELRMQRRELTFQREEIKLTRLEHAKSADQLNKQTTQLELQNIERRRELIEQELNSRLDNVATRIRNLSEELSATFLPRPASDGFRHGPMKYLLLSIEAPPEKFESHDKVLLDAWRAAYRLRNVLDNGDLKILSLGGPWRRVIELVEKIDGILLDAKSNVAPRAESRISAVELSGLSEALHDITATLAEQIAATKPPSTN